MNYITLEEVKQLLIIDDDFKEDDNYLLSLVAVALDVVEKHIEKKLYEYADEDGCLPDGLKHALLLLVGHFYDNREATLHPTRSNVTKSSVSKIPLGYEYLLDLYQNY